MKKYIFIVVLTLFSVNSIAGQDKYIIHGAVPSKYNEQYARLIPMSELKPEALSPESVKNFKMPQPIDSALIKNGKFILKGRAESKPSLYAISIESISGWVVLEKGDISLTYIESEPSGYFKSEGTPINEELTKISETTMDLTKSRFEYVEKRNRLMKTNEWTIDMENEMLSSIGKKALAFNDFISKFTKDNIEYPVGEYFLMMMGGNLKKEDMEEIEHKLSPELKNRIAARQKEFALQMQAMMGKDSIPEAVKEGKKYVDFTGEKVDGTKTELSKIIKSKKVILLDFWASWCAPCLMEMPGLVELYGKYKNKGLEIVGISLDKDKTAWKNMITKKNMTWMQVIDSDLSKPIADIYGAKKIPYTVLIDKDGNIIANNLRGEELKNKIEELLK